MNKELLYRFFEGKTSLSEEKQIKEWLEASEANRHIFFRERKTYDILLLTHGTVLKQKRKISLLPWISTAACLTLLLIFSGLYIFNERNSLERYNFDL